MRCNWVSRDELMVLEMGYGVENDEKLLSLYVGNELMVGVEGSKGLRK